jgi:hypothetical protein
MQDKVESIKEFFHSRFQKIFVKEFLIKLIAGLVKEPQAVYFSEDPLDFTKIEPSLVFTSLVSYLKDIMKQITRELGLDDEKRVFLGLVVFKERFMMFLLSNSLDLLRDILMLLPLSTKALPSDPNFKRLKELQTYFKELIDKIVIERKFTARFVSLSGQQNLMFGLWYLVLSLTSQL